MAFLITALIALVATRLGITLGDPWNAVVLIIIFIIILAHGEENTFGIFQQQERLSWTDKNKENFLKEKELELKERELKLKENEHDQKIYKR